MTAYRSIDGTGDNQNYNVTATDMTRVGTAHFADGISEPIETVNPRTVCNNVVGQGDANVANPEGFSAFMYSWGQFIDHDLDRVDFDGQPHQYSPFQTATRYFRTAPLIARLTRNIVDPTNQPRDQPDHRLARRQHGLWLDQAIAGQSAPGRRPHEDQRGR